MVEKENLEKLELLMNRFVSRNWENSFALLRGFNVREFIKSDKIIIGRKTSTSSPDIDLNVEGNTKGISRSHVELSLIDPKDGKFSITNIGKSSIYLNGNPIPSGSSSNIPHYGFLEVCIFMF